MVQKACILLQAAQKMQVYQQFDVFIKNETEAQVFSGEFSCKFIKNETLVQIFSFKF